MTNETGATAEAGSATIQTLDISGLMECLPHRYPFLMVDKISHMEGSRYIIGVKNVTFNEPHFLGHFPGQPVMPGVLIVEGMAQTAGAACVASGEAGGRAKVVYFMTVDKCKFRKPVVPGDRLEYHMTRINRRRNMWWFKGEAKVDGQIVAEAELGAMIVVE